MLIIHNQTCCKTCMYVLCTSVCYNDAALMLLFDMCFSLVVHTLAYNVNSCTMNSPLGNTHKGKILRQPIKICLIKG